MRETLSVFEVLKRPQISWQWLANKLPELAQIDATIAEQLEIEAHYDGYLSRQQDDIAVLRAEEQLEIPVNLNYDDIIGLSNEVREKLKLHTPATLAAAGRISGVTPSALTALWLFIKKSQEQSSETSK